MKEELDKAQVKEDLNLLANELVKIAESIKIMYKRIKEIDELLK